MPQCNGCGCCFPYLRESQCGSCAKKLKPRALKVHMLCTDWLTSPPFQGTNATDGTTDIVGNAKMYEGQASQHRLNQVEPTGPQKQRLESLKEKEVALKQQRKAEMFTIEAHLVLYPLMGSAFKKVCAFLESML